MDGSSVRVVLLTLAAWAVLFAPGAAADSGTDGAAPDPDRVASAIVAPTFGPDGVVVARPCRHDHEPTRVCPDLDDRGPAVADAGQGDLGAADAFRSSAHRSNERTGSVATRAPPGG